MCARPRDRAAVDFHDGIAVVERAIDCWEIVTILENWMSVGNLPLILDGGVANATPESVQQQAFSRRVVRLPALLSRADLESLEVFGR
jgi:hypothetical protein